MLAVCRHRRALLVAGAAAAALSACLGIYFKFCPKRGQRLQREVLPAPGGTMRGFTSEELSQFDGVKQPEVYVGLKGNVYRVSFKLYGPRGEYSFLAGKEASRPLAKSAQNDEGANADWATLSEQHLACLDRVEEDFKREYQVVGWFVPGGDYAARGARLALRK